MMHGRPRLATPTGRREMQKAKKSLSRKQQKNKRGKTNMRPYSDPHPIFHTKTLNNSRPKTVRSLSLSLSCRSFPCRPSVAHIKSTWIWMTCCKVRWEKRAKRDRSETRIESEFLDNWNYSIRRRQPRWIEALPKLLSNVDIIQWKNGFILFW